MKYFILFFIMFLLTHCLFGQEITGIITDANNEAIVSANVYLKGTYDGALSDTTGKFSFTTFGTDTLKITASFIGYETFDTSLVSNKKSHVFIKIILKAKSTEIQHVVITAGTFEAGDRKRGIQMNALDILTTANSNGDIFSALNTLPGAQLVGEEGALFVRGGEKHETKTFVDGMLVSNPYTSKVPDLPMRGRFTPSLFSGISFSSGGYSAEYGQALSSALILQTHAFPTKSLTSFSVFPFGADINHTWKGDSTSFSCSFDYLNLKPYFSIVPQKTKWNHAPENLSTTLMFRRKLGKSGLLKSFGTFGSNRLRLTLPVYLATDSNRNLKLNNNNIYINSVFNSAISQKSTLKLGISFNYDDELVRFDKFNVDNFNRVLQLRSSLQHDLSTSVSLKWGGEVNYQYYRQQYTRLDTSFSVNMNFNNTLIATFAEIEWKVTDKLFTRIGTRFEYTGLTHKSSLVPRIALAYKTGEHSQISVAYGIFSQLPQEDYLKFNKKMANEMATHYIINYQYSYNKRLLRIEAFSKEYSNLVRYIALNDPYPEHYTNDGYGYARGFEVFIRDQKTFKNGDFWISYTFLNTRKYYQDLPSLATPYLFSKHSLNAVGKHYFHFLKTQFGATYQYASGRPYYFPDKEYRQGITSDYHNFSINASYLTSLFKCFTIVHVSVSNVFGFNQVFGYHFIKKEGGENYSAYPVTPSAKRFFVIGLLVTLDKNYIPY